MLLLLENGAISPVSLLFEYGLCKNLWDTQTPKLDYIIRSGYGGGWPAEGASVAIRMKNAGLQVLARCLMGLATRVKRKAGSVYPRVARIHVIPSLRMLILRTRQNL